MNDTAKPSAPTAVVRLKLDSLTYDPIFTPRPGIAKSHVHDLARALRNLGDLDPIKVWAEPGTGRLIVLDGRHRVAAYCLNRMGSIPVVFFRGGHKDARLEAPKDNAKTTFPWTTAECTQYAWGLVIDGEASKREIVQASTVSTGTVSTMRRRRAALSKAGITPSGNWWRDRTDNKPEGQPEDDSDAAKLVRIAWLLKSLKETEKAFKAEFDRRPTPDEFGLSWRGGLGQSRFKAAMSGGFLFDEDEFSDNPEQHPLVQPKASGSADF